jgi:antirestriction protein ArdC
MPPFDAFVDPVAYYGTLLHEATHNAASAIMPRQS